MESKLFAWVPFRVTSGKWTWLNIYYRHRALYDETTGRPPLNSLYFTWTETASERSWRVLKETAIHNRNVWNDIQLTKEDRL
jgi:hypothetical protein